MQHDPIDWQIEVCSYDALSVISDDAVVRLVVHDACAGAGAGCPSAADASGLGVTLPKRRSRPRSCAA